MKNAAVSTAAKTAAIVLFVCALGGALLCGVGTLYLAAADAYDVAPAFSDTALCSSMASRYLFYAETDVIQACNPFADGAEDAALARRSLDALFDPEALNLRLRVTDASSGALYYGPADVEGLEAVTSRQIRYRYVENDVASGYLYGAEAAHAYPAETFPGPTLTPRPSDAAEDAAGTDAATPRPSDAADAADDAAAARVQERTLLLTAYLDPALPAEDTLAVLSALFSRLLAWRYALPILCLGLLLVTTLLYVYLLCAAGRRPGAEGVQPGRLHRVPTDVLYVCAAGLAALLLALASLLAFGGTLVYASVSAFVPLLLVCAVCGAGEALLLALASLLAFGGTLVYASVSAFVPLLLVCAVCGAGEALLLVGVSMSTAVRVKTRTWLSSMLVYRALRCLLRGARSAWSGVSAVLHGLPLVWKLLLACGGYVLLSVVLINEAFYASDLYLLLYLLLSAAGALLLCRYAVGFDRLRRGAQKLAGGDLVCRVETKGMPRGVRALAEDLGRVSEGAQRALEERMKSERMKTDLITNVSHDLKTPLTSIVNYVELLKKEELHNETAAGYVAVLDRQAQRLKKLTEDVVEASKASSGAINVRLAQLDAAELIRQCAAEYGERFAAAQLTPVLRLPDGPLLVRADGRLLWRVFDNLLGNAVKYAMPGTRVYFDAEAQHNEALLSVRNISREPLEKSGDELMERFVRGDASRRAEGSGLGLSIAGSLMALQGGTLAVLPDGDLFRADVRLPLASAKEGE